MSMNRRISAVAIVIMTLFMGSITAMLFFAGSSFPVRTAAAPQDSEFDTNFWNLTDALTLPLDTNNHSSSISQIEYENTSVPVHEWYFDYQSEVFNGNDIRINSVILMKQNLTTPTPAILYLHGFGERYAEFLEMLRELAAAGFVVMGIDQPGSGNTTGFPQLSPFTFLNVTHGPQSSSLYHSVWAAARALTLLETMPQVRTDATIVAGNSMGGLVTFIISGIDTRVDGSIPMIAGGNFLNSLTSGSLLNSIMMPTYQIGSQEIDNIIKWFDPLAYTRLMARPVLMMFGTNDQFFPIVSMMDTIESIQADLTLDIVPNWGHGVSLQWSHNIIRWIDNYFMGGERLPSFYVTYTNEVSLQGSGIRVVADVENADYVFLCWRSSEPGAVWFFTELEPESGPFLNMYTGEIVPLAIGKVLFFIVTLQKDSVQISSRIYTGSAGSVFFPILLVVSSIGILLLLHFSIWKPRRIHLVREVPYIIGVFSLSAGFILPLVAIKGRAGLSVFGFIELYGESFLLGGWFLPAVLTGFCLIIALSAFRHRFQFRAAVFLWSPLLVVIILLYIIFSGVFVYFGDIVSVEAGTGALALLTTIPAMQVFDKFIRLYFTKSLLGPNDDEIQ
jgi:pimeloyl-ACP methyl ester carboxylesterase